MLQCAWLLKQIGQQQRQPRPRQLAPAARLHLKLDLIYLLDLITVAARTDFSLNILA